MTTLQNSGKHLHMQWIQWVVCVSIFTLSFWCSTINEGIIEFLSSWMFPCVHQLITSFVYLSFDSWSERWDGTKTKPNWKLRTMWLKHWAESRSSIQATLYISHIVNWSIVIKMLIRAASDIDSWLTETSCQWMCCYIFFLLLCMFVWSATYQGHAKILYIDIIKLKFTEWHLITCRLI